MGKKEKVTESNPEMLDENQTATEEPQEEGSKKKKSAKKASKTDQLEQKLEETEAQLSEVKDKYIRLLAEFENFKRRNMKERLELMSTAAQDTMSVILPVLDDFDRAKKNAESDNSNESFSEGVTLVYNKIYSALSQKGLKPMDSNGVDFDPEYHEAITEIPAPTEEMKGKVIDTIEKGYFLKDKIIRYAKVVVGK